MIKNYIKRDDVIKCKLDLILIEKSIYYLPFTDHCREDADKFSIVAKTLIDFHRLLSRRRLIKESLFDF